MVLSDAQVVVEVRALQHPLVGSCGRSFGQRSGPRWTVSMALAVVGRLGRLLLVGEVVEPLRQIPTDAVAALDRAHPLRPAPAR
jgi:hypothetical protein